MRERGNVKMLEVEEDPSSQFVDFTNATALEQFVSDAEQTLIAWHLAGKGHASVEALEASHSASTPTTTYTRVLEFERPQWNASDGSSTAGKPPEIVKYALTLFVARGGAKKEEEEKSRNSKQWQCGREHFTPTMLAIADASKDLMSEGGVGVASAMEDEADRDGVVSATVIARDAERWFGVNEFLLVTRTSLPSEREKKMHDHVTSMRRSSKTAFGGRDGEAEDDAEQAGREGDNGTTTVAAAFDGEMGADEANLMLSAIHLALLSCNCTLPAFVPVQNISSGTWLGTAVPGTTGNVSINFETDSIPEVNSHQSCISGLMDFFQLKLQLPPHVEDKCRMAEGGDASDLSVGSWVSAAFRYAWRKDEDPREAEKQALEWRYASPSRDPQIDRMTRLLFGRSTHIAHYWGTSANPVSSVQMTAMWPNLREGTYVDNAVHSTLDPMTAPAWMVDVQFEDQKPSDWRRSLQDLTRKPTMPLSRTISNLVQAYSRARDLNRDILVSELAPNISASPPSSSSSNTTSLDQPSSTESYGMSSRLPDSIPAARAAVVLGNAIGSLTSSLVSAATWKGADVNEIRRTISELFDNQLKEPAVLVKKSIPSAISHTTPVGELVSVLACRMGQLHGVNAMSLLWVEFVKALRDRWFQQRLIPLLSTSQGDSQGVNFAVQSLDTAFLLESIAVTLPNPDFRQCLLHQKLQLLNLCILRQAGEHENATRSKTDPPSRSPAMSASAVATTRMSDLTGLEFNDDGDEDATPSDDEFFDSIENHEGGAATPQVGSAPLGVLRPIHEVTTLLTNAPMMEPVTQTAVPLTEDIAKQQQELLSRLGVGTESTALRQQIQSAALISDMQAFKAANPGACLADFIRWYSPKDWVPFDPLSAATFSDGLPRDGKNVWWFEGKGMLSERMRSTLANQSASSSLHLWHQMWESSAPVPVSKQKRLFDPVEESEKLYHYLETISPHEMFHQMLVGAISSCYVMLERACLPFDSIQKRPLSCITSALDELRQLSTRAVSLLDDAFSESQVALPTGRDRKEEQEKVNSQLQVAFEMALDACRAMTLKFEEVELLLSQSSALLQYFADDRKNGRPISRKTIQFVDALLTISHKRASSERLTLLRRSVSELLRDDYLRDRVASLVLHNPQSRDPVQREYIIRCICPRPYLDEYHYRPNSGDEDDGNDSMQRASADHDGSAILDLLEGSPVVVNRMYACFTKQTVRFALTLSESEF